MTQIKKVKTSEGVQFYPQTHTKAVIDDNGYSAESRMQAVQDVVNQAQMQIGAVPSDLTPTENSTNWVTSGGVYNAVQPQNISYDNSQSGLAAENVQEAVDELNEAVAVANIVKQEYDQDYITDFTNADVLVYNPNYISAVNDNGTISITSTASGGRAFVQFPTGLIDGEEYLLTLDFTNTVNKTVYGLFTKDNAAATPDQFTMAGTSGSVSKKFTKSADILGFRVPSTNFVGGTLTITNIKIKSFTSIDSEFKNLHDSIDSLEGVVNDAIESIDDSIFDAKYAVVSTTTFNLTCNNSTTTATYKQYYKFAVGKEYRITLSVESAASEIIELIDLPRTGNDPWINVMNLPTGSLFNTVIYTPSSTNGYLQAFSSTKASNGKAVTAVIEELVTLKELNDDFLSTKSDISTNNSDIAKIEDQVYYESGMTYKSYTGNRITPNRIGFKAIGSIVTGQSAAVFGDIAFVFGNGGRNAAAFNMKTRTVASSYVPMNGAPSKTDGTAWHCNSSEFGTNYYAEGDAFPLLYIGGSQGDAIHELLVCRVMPDASRVYHLDVVQVLTMPDAWGYANVAFDEERGKIVLCRPDMIFRVCTPPAVVDGEGNPISTYTFTEEDVEQTITIDASSFPVAQDAAMHRGLLYLGNGHGTQDNSFFRVIDLYNGTLINDISIAGWFTDAAEGYSFYNEHMYIFGSANIYKLWFM